MKNLILKILVSVAMVGASVFGLSTCAEKQPKDYTSAVVPDTVYLKPEAIDCVRVERDTFNIKCSIDRFLITEPSDTLTFEGERQRVKVYKDLKKNFLFIDVQ